MHFNFFSTMATIKSTNDVKMLLMHMERMEKGEPSQTSKEMEYISSFSDTTSSWYLSIL